MQKFLLYDGIVIGGGIIGLATVHALSSRFPDRKFLLLEKEPEIGTHQTGHNSGVIHSGIYYRPGSLKARMCREGAEALILFCREHGIPHKICGKVIVATRESELSALQTLYERGKANGIPNLSLIGPERLREIEPHVEGLKALHVPGTAVVDFGQVAATFATSARQKGVDLRTSCRVERLRFQKSEWILETSQGVFRTKSIINCAGLYADRIAKTAGAKTDVAIIPFRGDYFELKPEKSGLVKTMIYPVPNPLFPFLGVHLTRRISGKVEAGPNAVLALKREGYGKADFNLKDTVNMLGFPGFWMMSARYGKTGISEWVQSLSKPAFVKAVQRFVPKLKAEDFTPGKSGVRAQAVRRDGSLLDDFHIIVDRNAVHVLNVPSPAATASLRISEFIAEKVEVLFP